MTRPSRIALALAGAAVVAIAVTGCAPASITDLIPGKHDSPPSSPSPTPTPTPTPTSFTVTGVITTLPASYAPDEGASCKASEGYDDVEGGGQVEVRDASGTTLALGSLADGIMTADDECSFDFVVPGVPVGEAIYAVQIGDEDRSTIKFTEKKIREPLSLTLV